MEAVDLVRVVAVSPGDVQAEREALQEVVDELNRGVAVAQRRRISLWRWEADARPGMHLQGPQGLIDEMMDIQNADVVIGVFWTRFGSPTHDAQSGTEHELRRAWAAWKERGRPEVMIYFCTRPFVPGSSTEVRQRRQVLDFLEAMPEQLWWRFEGLGDLERLAREHLTRYLLRPPSALARAGHQASARAGVRPRLRFNLPIALPCFTGREEELAALDVALGVADRAVITQAITGLGGVGKSQLAARYLREREASYDVVAWIRAEGGGIVDLAALATELGEHVADLSPHERADRALHWLNHSKERWLLVLDNVRSPQDLLSCCPRSGNGSVLVTSRHTGMRQFGPILPVGVFDEDTATSYLIRQAGKPTAAAGARRLARALGCLPLALSHAGAYCAAGTSFDDYIGLLVALPASTLFDTSPESFYEHTVATTWKISIAAAAEDAPTAWSILAMASHLAPDAIPTNLFRRLIDDDQPAERKGLIDGLNALHRYSLVDVDTDAETLSVHRLVQKTVREDLVAQGDPVPSLHALDAVDAAFPHDSALPASWPTCEQLLPHVLALAGALKTPCVRDEQLVCLLNDACVYVANSGGVDRAVGLAEIALEHAVRIMGAEHQTTREAQQTLAAAYESAGLVDDAIVLAERLLADRERILGVEHPATIIARGKVARYYMSGDRTAEAVELGERVLAESERLLGPEDRDTLIAGGNLAVYYDHAGRVRKAISLGERILAASERTLGSEHPDTLRARGNLTSSYFSAGRTREAIRMREALVADRDRVLGPDHPNTIVARAQLAESYEAAGRISDAIALEERVLTDREHNLGLDHVDTLGARRTLASYYQSGGRETEAIAHQERLLADSRRILGADHPDTQVAQANLATMYQLVERSADAIVLGQQVVADYERLLGTDHADTLAVRANLSNYNDTAKPLRRRRWSKQP